MFAIREGNMRNFVRMSTCRLGDKTADHSVGSVPAEDWQWAGQEAGVDFMSRLSATNRRRILEGSTRAVYRAGTIVIKPDGPPHTFVIERGLARCYWSVPDRRQATVAFLHPQELVCPTIIGDPACTFVQAVTESTLTSLDPETGRELAPTQAAGAAAMTAPL